MVFHSSITAEQRFLLKIILGDMYIDCKSALEISRLDTLGTRRDARCLDFALKCVRHKKNRRLLSIKSNIPTCRLDTWKNLR